MRLRVLKFAEVAEGDISLGLQGRLFVDADTHIRKQIFAEQLFAECAAGFVYLIGCCRAGREMPRRAFGFFDHS